MRALTLLLLAVVGCGAGGPAEVDSPEAAKQERSLHARLREGAYQLGLAQDALSEAIGALPEGSAAREAVEEVKGFLDSAGSSIAEFVEVPDEATVEADFAAHDEMRLKAIEAANDALHETAEAQGILRSMAEDGLPVSDALDKLDAAVAALAGAVEAFGGDVEEPPAGE